MIVERLHCFFITSVRGKSFPEVSVFMPSDWFKAGCRASIRVLWLNLLPAKWGDDVDGYQSF